MGDVGRFQRFNVRSDESTIAKLLPQAVFNFARGAVCLVERGASVHAEMHFNGRIITDVAGTQVVRVAHPRLLQNGFDDEAFLVGRKRLFEQFLHTRHKQLNGHLLR